MSRAVAWVLPDVVCSAHRLTDCLLLLSFSCAEAGTRGIGGVGVRVVSGAKVVVIAVFM